MKKEKTIRTYQRRTKTGKVVTVKQHTAKYDAAEALKEAAKKKGSGDELENLKKKKSVEKVTEEELSDFMELLDQLPSLKGDEESRNLYIRDFKKAKGKEGRQAEIDNLKWEIKEEKKNKRAAKADAKFAASLKLERNYGFTADEYKAWYHWDQDADPKNKSALKVEKALKKQMGTKAYNKYFDEMSDNYSSRGHNKAFKGLGDTLSMGDSKKKASEAKASHSYSLQKDAKGGWIVADENGKSANKMAYTSKADARKVLKEFESGSRKHYDEIEEPKAKKSSTTPKKNANDSDLVEHYDQFNKKSMGKAVGDSFTFSEGRGKDKFTYDARFVTDGKGRYGYVVRDKAEGPDAKYYVGISDGYERHSQLPAGLRKAAEAQGLRFKNGEFVKKETKGDRAVARMNKLVNEALSSTTSDPKALKKQLGALIDYNGGPVNRGDKIGKRIDEIREQLGKRSSKKRVDKKSDYDYETSMKNLENYFAEERRKITSKSKTPRRGSKAAYEAAQKAKASLTSYVDASPYKRILKSMNTYGGQVNKNELIGKLVKKGLSHAEASKIAGQFSTKVKTEFTKSRQYKPGAK